MINGDSRQEAIMNLRTYQQSPTTSRPMTKNFLKNSDKKSFIIDQNALHQYLNGVGNSQTLIVPKLNVNKKQKNGLSTTANRSRKQTPSQNMRVKNATFINEPAKPDVGPPFVARGIDSLSSIGCLPQKPNAKIKP